MELALGRVDTTRMEEYFDTVLSRKDFQPSTSFRCTCRKSTSYVLWI
jgi:hypothetical protein